MRRTIAVIAACALLLTLLPACGVMRALEISPAPSLPAASPAASAQCVSCACECACACTCACASPREQASAAPSSAQATPAASNETVKSIYPESEVVEFADKQVEEVIRATLKKPDGDITAGDMAGITSFVYDPVNDKSAAGTITTIDDLRYCVNLETLRVLRQEQVTSLECLRAADNIQSVIVLGCSISDLSPLAGKIKLREITLNGNPVTDASPVLVLPNLVEFNAYYGTNVTDISALPAASSLQNFFCDNKLKDFTPLLRLKNLKAVTLVGVSDGFFREMVQKYRNMSSIRISFSDIKEESLKLLEGYNLYGLSLENCGLKDISGLAGLRGVSDLRLGGNQIEDISALKGFTQIGYCLDLRNNKIRDFSPLESIRLSSLWVMGNPRYTKASKAVLDKLEEEGCKVYR